MVLVAEGVLWPAERRLQVSVVALHQGGTPVGEEVRRDARAMMLSATTGLVLLVLGAVLMVVQP